MRWIFGFHVLVNKRVPRSTYRESASRVPAYTSNAGGFSRLAGPSYAASSAATHRSTPISRSPASHRAAPASSSMVPLCAASGASSNARAASDHRFSSSNARPRQSG